MDLVDQICMEIEAAQKFEAVRTPGSKVLRPHQSASSQQLGCSWQTGNPRTRHW